MSLKSRLSLVSLGLLLLLLLVGGAFQYVALGEYLRRDEAAALQRRYTQTIRDLTVVGRGRVCPAGSSGTSQAKVIGGRLTPAAAACMVNALAGPQVTAVVIDSAGDVIASAPADTYPTLPLRQYLQASRGRVERYYVTGSGGDESLIVLHSLTPRAARPLGVVQMSEPTAPLRTTQQRLLFLLAVATGALMLVAVAVMPLLVRRALRPLQRVTEASTALAGGDLSRRVEPPSTRDELGRLARAFNEMATAVQRAFTIRAESEAGVRSFVSDASHELRTPLTTLQGQLDVLSRGAAEDREARRHSLAAMQRDVRRMSALVEDLLTLTRLDAAGARGTPGEPVDLDQVIAETVDEESVRAPDQRVEVVRGAAGNALVLGDREQLRRVVLNLANNALKYASGGVHSWRTEVQGESVVMTLTDQGPGIPAEALPRIFDRFYRGQMEGGSRVDGTGLGLAIVKSIAEAHGGGVEASSNGYGTTVTVRLPRASAAGGHPRAGTG